ncbi:DNA-binding response regulator [Sphaerisporangium melleum]|uniref:DNA-binding response regulator n=1 Tax=Sphaerisporangium melleum TaxID=321316 RepID=A0A917QXC7_9ACTN|nr:response regulator transcription factor [Sphaerisporangium melleum]GGK73053.1 DNA-binding response regulator [Sphaerisporangium melleum]GII68258.1 DNA-binding response regulator [Sphaerisporangium melleum]
MIRVLIADDEPLIGAGIRTVLESAPGIEVVAQVTDGGAAVAEARARRVDVALIDIKMPRMDGLRAAEELRLQAPAVRTVMLTSFGDEANVLRALQGGVSGFVLKNCTAEELIRAVRAAHDGEAYLSPMVTRLVLGMVAPTEARQRREATQRLSALSPRETEIVHLVAEGMSNAGIGRRLNMSETTIKTYVSRILGKLGCSNRVQVALLVRDTRR